VLLATLGIGFVWVVPRDAATPTTGPAPFSLAPSIGFAAPAPSAPAVPAPAQARSPSSLPPSVPVGLSIPSLSVTSPVMALGLEDDGTMEVPPGAYPAGWYEGSPTPGEIGPAVLAAHVDWAGEPGVFHRIRELRPGDEVAVTRQDGSVATFAVDRVEDHPKDEFPTTSVYGDLDHAGLRLITCGGAFDEDTGDYADNVVVFATYVPPAA
jgi:LPXTG-site transpeptidase (sortase) family protein